MKKTIIVSAIILLLTGFAFGEDIDLGNFPIGQWLDHNYDAVWDFSSGNIRILALDGSEYFDFSKNTVNDFKVSGSTAGAVITFSCPEAGRSYKLTKPLTNTDVILEIERPGKKPYKVEMKKK